MTMLPSSHVALVPAYKLKSTIRSSAWICPALLQRSWTASLMWHSTLCPTTPGWPSTLRPLPAPEHPHRPIRSPTTVPQTTCLLLTSLPPPAFLAPRDSITNQDFFSVEGFLDFFKQLLAFYTTPDLETPTYSVLRWGPGTQCWRVPEVRLPW
jgi:hypothetical protein